MTKPKTVLIATLVMLSAPLCGLLAAQDANPNPNARIIEVSGTGEAQATPDLATLQLAIETHAPTAAEAAGSNGALAQKVRGALNDKLGDKGRMWTGGYSLYPEYNEHPGGGKPTVAGYRAVNSLTVETGSLELVGPLIDAAIAAGANQVNSLDYSLRDNTRARSNAIANAAKDAAAQAQSLAAALGVRLGQVVKATTEAQVQPIMFQKATMSPMLGRAPTPIEPGQVTVPATVSLTYEIQ
jgi:uncharacterized protein